MKKIILFTLCAIIVGCKKSENVIGMYVSRNNVNTVDSLWVNDDGFYINLMFRKKDNSLVYRNTGKWSVDNNYIIFENFFCDEDEIHSIEFTKYEEVLMTKKFPIEKMNEKIIIHHKSMYDNIYLEKIR